ncbi:hypothetical protein [Sphaerothrix gracilis]
MLTEISVITTAVSVLAAAYWLQAQEAEQVQSEAIPVRIKER